MVPFWLLICIGALVVGSIEGWSFIESMYFSVVSLTTVGYGDFAPRKVASTWFTIIWLPFSVFFVSLYLGSIASFYIGMSNRNVNRIERKLRRKMQRVKTWQEKERDEARLRGLSGGFGVMNNDDDDGGDGGANHTMNNTLPSHIKTPPKMNDNKGFSSLSTNTPDDTNSVDAQSPPTKDVGFRRNEILQKSGSQRTTMSDSDGTVITDHRTERNGETMKTMKDVITAIKLNMSSSRRSLMEESDILGHHGHRHNDNTGGKQEILNLYSTKHYNTARGVVKKPTFALRVLVQERLAQIVAHEVAGYQSNVEIKNNTLSVTIDSLKFTCEKWLLPKRSTKSFRSVAFETLYFVGERSLIVRGAEAVFELRPAEVQGLFGPVLAAMGDADTMEAWLNRTQMLAQTELGQNSGDTDFKLNLVDDRRSNQITQNMTSKPKQQRVVIGNAFTNN
jgi:voltage-gated potassium channel